MSSVNIYACQLLLMASFIVMSTSFESGDDITRLIDQYNDKEMEGYPNGFISDCPNITIPINKNDLKKLRFVVRGTRSSKKIKYNYYQMGLLAKDPHMDWSKKIVLYIGGYMSHPSHVDGRAMEAIYTTLGYNVWLLDEFAFIVGVYPAIARLIRFSGSHAGEMLAELTNMGVLDPANIEMVGPSLAGQIMSFVAKRYNALTGKKIARLTAFDPSGPCFRHLGPEHRLDKSDGEFVTVIMTNIDGFGSAAPVGHVNFYVNGGEYQVDSKSYIPCEDVCSHVRSYLIWAAALLHPDGFIGIKCNSVQQARNRRCYENVPMITNVLSPKTDPSKPGIFYLSTTNKYPYFLGEKGLLIENDAATLMFRQVFKNIIKYHETLNKTKGWLS